MKNRILVTGGSGMLGRSIKDLIDTQDKNEWLFISSKDYNLTNLEECFNLFQSFNPTIVIHLASRVGGLYDNMNHNYDFYMTCTRINSNIIECCKKYNTERLISILSTCIYGDNIKISTDNIHDVAPHPSNKGYAYSKRFLDIGTELLSQTGTVECINIIPTNLYGIYDNYEPKSSHVVAALLSRIYKAKMENKDCVEIYGSGLARRQFLNSFDLAKIILIIATTENKELFKRIIISGKQELRICDLVDIIVDIIEYKGKIIYNLEYSDGQMQKYAKNDVSFDNFPFTPLELGLKEIIEIWKKRDDTINLNI